MKKNIWIILLLSGVMLFVFAGCGGGVRGGSSSRTNPAKINETVIYDSMREDYNACKLEMTMQEVLRGGAALKMAKEANSYNDVPPDGQEYMLVKFSINALESKNDAPIEHLQYSFGIVRSDGSVYEQPLAFIIDIGEMTTMYEGSSQEGYISFLVDENDEDLLIVFPQYGQSQVWFSGTPTAGGEFDDYNPLGDPNKPGSQNNPVGINETANFNGIDLRGYSPYNVDITVTEINRGQRAMDMLTIADKYNDAPPAGKEYIVAKVTVDAIDSKDGGAIDIGRYDFTLFSSAKIEYTDRAYASGLEVLSQMYPGASQEGYLVFLVDESDSEPFIVAFKDSETPVWITAAQSDTEPLIDQNALGKKSNPVPMTKSIVCEVDDYSGAYTLKITMKDWVRASSDSDLAELGFEGSLGSGVELLLVQIEIEAIESSENDGKIKISDYDFELVSENGMKYDRLSIYGVTRLGDMYEGAVQEGILYFQVSADDENPLIVFNERYGDDPVWFKLSD